MDRLRQIYLTSVLFILLLTASLKGVEVFRSAPYTRTVDFVFVYIFGGTFWTTGKVMALGAGLELATAGILKFSKDHKFQNFVLVMLSCSFVMYRLTGWAIQAPGLCPCLGFMGDWLKLSNRFTNNLALGILAYFLAGGTIFLWLSWKQPSAQVAIDGPR
jgi:hypothetical protein